MMKKVLAILLMFFYIIPVIGINVSMHYCGGELASVSHELIDTKKCLCSSDTMEKGCCEDKQQTFKLDNDQQKTSIISPSFLNPNQLAAIQNIEASIPDAFMSIAPTCLLVYQPPNFYERDIYIKNCVYRI